MHAILLLSASLRDQNCSASIVIFIWPGTAAAWQVDVPLRMQPTLDIRGVRSLLEEMLIQRLHCEAEGFACPEMRVLLRCRR